MYGIESVYVLPQIVELTNVLQNKTIETIITEAKLFLDSLISLFSVKRLSNTSMNNEAFLEIRE